MHSELCRTLTAVTSIGRKCPADSPKATTQDSPRDMPAIASARTTDATWPSSRCRASHKAPLRVKNTGEAAAKLPCPAQSHHQPAEKSKRKESQKGTTAAPLTQRSRKGLDRPRPNTPPVLRATENPRSQAT